MKLRGDQRKYLRGLAHPLKPTLQVGKAALGGGFLEELDEALARHELLKVKFLDHRGRKDELAAEIADRLDCEHVGTIGHVAIFYRPALDPDHRQIELPA